MPKIKFYVIDTDHGREARSSKTGDPIRGNITERTHELVAEEVGRHAREEYREARRQRARNAAAIRAERRAGGGGARPRAPRIGIRALAGNIYNANKARYAREGDPYDGYADKNTARMVVKLAKHSPDALNHMMQLKSRHNANYIKYNPVSHSIEMYTHRQVYLVSYQLPDVLRSKKVVGPIQHKPRYTVKTGATDIFTTTPEGLQRNHMFHERPPHGRDY